MLNDLLRQCSAAAMEVSNAISSTYFTHSGEINQSLGTKGADPGWDWVNITGTLTLASTTGSKFKVDLTSLTLANTSGVVADFNSTLNSSYTIATASGGILGFSADKFSLSTTNFVNSLNGGSWSIDAVGNNLNLNFTAVPEPSTWALLLLGLAALVPLARRRR